MDVNTLFQWLGFAGGIVTVLGYLWGLFRKGTEKATIEAVKNNQNVLTLVQAQVKAMEEVAANQREEIIGLKDRVGTLEGVIKEKDKEISNYLQIFQGRSPEMTEFIKAMTSFTAEMTAIAKSNDIKIDAIFKKLTA